MKHILLVFFFTSVLIFSQSENEEEFIQQDTSFSLASTNRKVLKEFPVARQIENTIPENVSAINNVIYKTIGKRKLHLDIYLSKGNRKDYSSTILLIHGGGWSSGNKSMEKYFAGQLALKGFIVVAVEYRLSPEAQYPAALQDLKSALKWINQNSRKFRIDKNRVFLLGESAGGHLATLVGVTSKNSKLNIKISKQAFHPSVKGIINLDGVMDMTTPSESVKDSLAGKPVSAAGRWLGSTLHQNPELWREVSPINYIDKNTPPILFINSSIPRYHAGRDEAVKIMTKFGIYSEVHTIPGTPHPFWYFHPWVDEAIEHVVKFIYRLNMDNSDSK